ncbi:hypothetical protein FACS189476_06820 [Spirochaetia bacterium]|nr:hypothetical protein FACS189476_06820 [Spirochaetia bacterium]
MFKKHLPLVLIIGFFFVSCSGSSNPLDAPDLEGEELESFLNSNFHYWSGWGSDELKYYETIDEIFYTNKQSIGFDISPPKHIGKKDKGASIAIIIQENGKTFNEANTIVYITYSDGVSKLDNIRQKNDGQTVRLDEKLGEMTDAMNKIYPDSFFSEYYKRWELLGHEDFEKMIAEREKATEERREGERIEAEKALYTDKQRTAAYYRLKQSDVKNFFIIDDEHQITDGLDFTGDNYFVVTGNAKSLELNRDDGKGKYYLIDITDDTGDRVAVSCTFVPGFIDELPAESRRDMADARNKLIWNRYPGDGKYQIFYAASISAGIVIIGFKNVN